MTPLPLLPLDLGGFGHNHPLGASSDVMNGCCQEAPWYPPPSPPTGESPAAAPFIPIASTSVDDGCAPSSFRVSSPKLSPYLGVLGAQSPFKKSGSR